MPVELSAAQRTPTTGARGVEPFTVDDYALLAIRQMAKDVPGRTPLTTGGNSNTEVLPRRLPVGSGGDYEPWQPLPAPGGEYAEDDGFARINFVRDRSQCPYRRGAVADRRHRRRWAANARIRLAD